MTRLVRASLVLALSGVGFVACASGVTEQPNGGGGAGGEVATTTSAGGAGGATATSSSTGTPGPCVHKEDCAALDDTCNEGNCVNGTCEKTPANEGGACDDGLYCTENDACQAGQCVGGTAKYCSPPDSCHLGVCDEASKSCVPQPGNDGASCDDGDPCTYAGICSGGACAKGPPVDCSAFSSDCADGVCDPVLGCQAKPKNDGAACDDGLFCTVNDACKAGVCTGDPNTCAAPGDVCMIGTCDEAQKSCVAVPGNDGVACDDGNPCTVSSTCSNGQCTGGVPGNEGQACDDGNGCTTGTTCSNGTCTNVQSTITQCANGDGCCPAGCAIGTDDDCSLTKWSEGTADWPDDACNPINSFGQCDSNDQASADAWATWVCQHNGYSSGIWTGNKQGGCNGDISMWCQDQIPCNPTFENACVPGDQTKVEFTCFK